MTTYISMIDASELGEYKRDHYIILTVIIQIEMRILREVRLKYSNCKYQFVVDWYIDDDEEYKDN